MVLFRCCKKKVEEPVYELDDARHWMQQLDKGWERTISSFEVCKLLLDFPTSSRRTRTSPISLHPENQPLHDRLLRILSSLAFNALAESERMAYSFWNSFATTQRPFPVTPDLQRNKLEAWLHLHNFVKRKRSDRRHVRLNAFAYLIDPKATLKHLNIFKVTNIERVMLQVLEADLNADREEKAIEKQVKQQEEQERRRQKYFKQVKNTSTTKKSARGRAPGSSDSDDDDDDDSSSDSDDSDSDNSDDDDGDSDDESVRTNRYPELPPAIAAALNELHDSLDQAQELAATLKDEWGNKVSKQELDQREKVVIAIRRKMDKWFLKASGAKFEPFRRCEKSLKKAAARFERKLGQIIADALARRESQKRAQRRIDLFNEEQTHYQSSARYDRPTSDKDVLKRSPGALGPELRCKPGGRLFWRPWKEPANSRSLTFSWVEDEKGNTRKKNQEKNRGSGGHGGGEVGSDEEEGEQLIVAVTSP
jgi:hypothetical protein